MSKPQRSMPVSYRPQPGRVMGAIIVAVFLFWFLIALTFIIVAASSA
jgi:hypothetical protein